ncbi:MAG: type II toxin-antitoxin system RelE/ParE family toxin [Symploca sp. SIO3E6]|nr:type II toxin-antitoxin system RelE/ParE family toxin [Caldora sp. SIO3E6]
MTQYIITPEAIKDLKMITDYLAQNNLKSAEQLLKQFNKKCYYLVQFPKIGRSYHHIRPSLRGLPLNGYIIFYRLSQDTIEIMRVIKGNRDLGAIFNTDEEN